MLASKRYASGIKQTQIRNGPLNASGIKKTRKETVHRYWESPESARNQYGSLTINYASSITHRNNVHEKKKNETSKLKTFSMRKLVGYRI